MGTFPETWRTIDEAAASRPERPAPDTRRRPGDAASSPPFGQLLVAAVLLISGLLATAGVVLVAWSAAPSEVVIGGGDVAGFGISRPLGTIGATADASRAPVVPALELVVDVEGAVARPGVYRVPAGARVGDAIAIAGGFGLRVDADAVSRALNLAAPLADGEKITVPALGDQLGAAAAPTLAAPGSPATGGAPGAAALIDLNTAGSAELESLPGIGPVYAGAIIAARETQPFATVDEVRARGVLGPATFEKIRPLVTVGP